MFSLLLVILISSCSPEYIIYDSEDHSLAYERSKIKDYAADDITVQIRQGSVDVVVSESLFHVQDAIMSVNYFFCPVSSMVTYFGSRPGHTRFSCRSELDSHEIYLVEVTLFPDEEDRLHYACFANHHEPPAEAIIMHCRLISYSPSK